MAPVPAPASLASLLYLSHSGGQGREWLKTSQVTAAKGAMSPLHTEVRITILKGTTCLPLSPPQALLPKRRTQPLLQEQPD